MNSIDYDEKEIQEQVKQMDEAGLRKLRQVFALAEYDKYREELGDITRIEFEAYRLRALKLIVMVELARSTTPEENTQKEIAILDRGR